MSQSTKLQAKIDEIDNTLFPAASLKKSKAEGIIRQAPGIIADAIRLDQQGGCPLKFGATNARQRKKYASEIAQCQNDARALNHLWSGYLASANSDLKLANSEIEILNSTRSTYMSELDDALENERAIDTTKSQAAAYEQTQLANLGLSFSAAQIEAEASGQSMLLKTEKDAEIAAEKAVKDAEISAKKATVRRNITILVAVTVVMIGSFWAWNKFKK